MNKRLTMKVAIVIALTILLLIPLTLIGGVVDERANYRHSVEWDIARTWTGQQRLMGPILAVPYEVKFDDRFFNKETKKYEVHEKTRIKTVYLIADKLSLDGTIDTEHRSRGIYKVPVYTSDITLNGHFSTEQLDNLRKDTRGFSKWLAPSLSIVIGDVRGISSNPTLRWNGNEVEFAAGSLVPNLANGIHAGLPVLPTTKKLVFSTAFKLRGSQLLQLSAIGKDVGANLQSGWQHPKFDGQFLPVSRTVDENGFTAMWQTSSFSTGVEKKLLDCVAGECGALQAMGFDVQFIESVDVYQKVTRAIKYGILFIVLTFVAFFLTEALTGTQLHPVQYTLVGFALAMFYLLLISLSEHFLFATSYLLATVSCVLLIGIYLTGALKSSRQGFAYSIGITLLYAMLFAILRSEDFALLMGSMLLFSMLAAVMILTRRVDWFNVGRAATRT